MSEAKVPREIAVIQSEYQQLCTKLGHISYQIDALSKDAAIVNSSLRELNLEAVASQQAAAEAKPALSAVPAENGEAK